MQFQADLLGCPVEVAAEQETTALGAAALAGRAIGLWPDDDAIRRLLEPGAVYEPAADREAVAARRTSGGGRHSTARSSLPPRLGSARRGWLGKEPAADDVLGLERSRRRPRWPHERRLG